MYATTAVLKIFILVCLQAATAAESGDGLTRSLPGAVVCISVGVTKASGLQVLYPRGY